MHDERTATLEEAARHRSADIAAVQRELEQAKQDLHTLRSQADEIRSLWQKVERALEAPRAEFNKLAQRRAVLERDIDRRISLQAELRRASTGYQRAMVHQECERLLGNGSPEHGLRERRDELRRVVTDMEKLGERLEDLGQRASRDIRSLFLDGNNMCFEGRRFVGLAAVDAAVRSLAPSYAITVVFDASICPRLDMPADGIRRMLGDAATVHIVPPRTRADETLLALAVGSYAFVVSNDRFADFREKPAVREARLIRHEIVGGRLLIHDLGLDVALMTP